MQKRLDNERTHKISRTIVLLAFAAAIAGCSDGGNSPANSNTTETGLPVSISELKTALLNKIADPHWMDTWNAPQSEQDWREVEHLAYQVEVGAMLLKMPGTGPMDESWVANPDWQQMAEQLAQDGARAVSAVRSRNRELMDRAGPQLIETCEACHQVFAPDVPLLSSFRDGEELPVVSR